MVGGKEEHETSSKQYRSGGPNRQLFEGKSRFILRAILPSRKKITNNVSPNYDFQAIFSQAIVEELHRVISKGFVVRI